jgi:phasin family protein
MSKAEFPFMGADFSKMFSEFKMPDFGKQINLGDFKMPNVDMDGIMASQRKNIDALTQANKLAAEGFLAVAKRQGEIFKETMEYAQTAMKDVVSGTSPEASAGKQADFVKTAFEKALANAKELAELTAKANSETFDIINKRVVESLDELKATAKTKK